MNSHPSYRNTALESIARNVLKAFNSNLLITPQAIPIENIMEQQYGLRFDYQYIRNNGRILGETVFDNALVPIYDKDNGEYTLVPMKGGTVIIDASLIDNKSDGRFMFTCAHELSHWLIHHGHYSGSGQTAAMTDTVRSSQADKMIERQADRLGCYLLMPSGTVKKAFYQTHGDKMGELTRLFGVSRQAMEIRLNEMGLFN